jgi:hypothetical protein
VAELSTDQFSALRPQQIAVLTTDQIQALTTDQVVAFTTAQIGSLSTADILAMSPEQIAAFEAQDIGAMSIAQINAFLQATPIVLDLDGNGIHTLAAANGVNFDLLGTGHASKAGWVSPTDGLLVMDRNHDGKINDGTELFGVATLRPDGTRAGNGYAAMALEDSNHDGKLSATDTHFKDLRVWVDANHNGVSDAGELKTLAELGIVSLDLHAKTSTSVDNGNLIGLVSSYTTADGAQHEMADVWFAREAAPAAPNLNELLAGPAAEVLPASLAVAAAPAPTAVHEHAAVPHTPPRGFGDTRPMPLI